MAVGVTMCGHSTEVYVWTFLNIITVYSIVQYITLCHLSKLEHNVTTTKRYTRH
jgi:hypothetical protein